MLMCCILCWVFLLSHCTGLYLPTQYCLAPKLKSKSTFNHFRQRTVAALLKKWVDLFLCEAPGCAFEEWKITLFMKPSVGNNLNSCHWWFGNNERLKWNRKQELTLVTFKRTQCLKILKEILKLLVFFFTPAYLTDQCKSRGLNVSFLKTTKQFKNRQIITQLMPH